MGGFVIILPFMSVMIGLYFITLGLWELREGANKSQYVKYMFTGLFIILALTPLIALVANFLNFRLS